MEIQCTNNGDTTVLTITGRLDAKTATELENAVTALTDPFTKLVLDCAELVYLSSAGLRVIQTIRKKLAEKQAQLVLRQVRPVVMEILNVTGFSSILTIEA